MLLNNSDLLDVGREADSKNSDEKILVLPNSICFLHHSFNHKFIFCLILFLEVSYNLGFGNMKVILLKRLVLHQESVFGSRMRPDILRHFMDLIMCCL